MFSLGINAIVIAVKGFILPEAGKSGKTRKIDRRKPQACLLSKDNVIAEFLSEDFLM